MVNDRQPSRRRSEERVRRGLVDTNLYDALVRKLGATGTKLKKKLQGEDGPGQNAPNIIRRRYAETTLHVNVKDIQRSPGY